MKRYAFTMLELVFVIVVLGIMAVLAMPRLDRDPLAEAAEQVARHIRYTQHLAMVDDRFDPTNPQWYSEMWVFRVHHTSDVNNNSEEEWFYEVFSDNAPYNGNSTINEEAIDPLTKQTLGNGSLDNTVADDKIINLTRQYGITNVTFSGGNNPRNDLGPTRVAFDNLGRPYRDADPNANANWRTFMLTSNLNITLFNAEGNATITVTPITGHVSVTYN